VWSKRPNVIFPLYALRSVSALRAASTGVAAREEQVFIDGLMRHPPRKAGAPRVATETPEVDEPRSYQRCAAREASVMA
jgi:hypothetical protein